MASVKQFKQAEKGLARQQRALAELQNLARDIERCEKTISDLKAELESINSKHQGRRTTRDDIAYLTDLLRCANKKLVWEKQSASVQKRTPLILETVPG
jgi:t-SNARE complex subunit (syntaxin)